MLFPFSADRQFHQVCWVVPDLRVAVEEFTKATGAGPWFWFDNVTFEEALYRGQPADFPNITAALGQAGDVQIELVSHTDDRPSFFNDVVPNGQMGFHDIAYYCRTYDADLASYVDAGVEIAFSASRFGIRTCWVDTTPTVGFMIQLAEASDVMDAAFGRIREAAQGWDGTDLIRRL